MAVSLHLRLQKVTSRDQILLENIKLEIAGPGLFWIQGPNGSGKSILASVVAGKEFIAESGLLVDAAVELHTSDGKIVNAEKDPVGYAEYVSFLPQKLGSSLLAIHHQDDICFGVEGVFPRLEGTTIYKKDQGAISRVNDIIETLNVWVHLTRKFGQCSYGETRRVEFACTCSPHSDIVILDEPFSGLDTSRCSQVVQAIKHFARSYESIWIITSHEPPERYGLKPDWLIELPLKTEKAEGFKIIARKLVDRFMNNPVNKFERKEIQLRNLMVERYGDFPRVVELRSFHAKPNTITYLAGKNGSGKTTVALVLAGLLRPSRLSKITITGDIVWGLNEQKMPSAPNNKVRLALQNPFKNFVCPTVREDLQRPNLQGCELEDVGSILGQLGDDKTATSWGKMDRPPIAFSFGQLKFLQLLLIPKTVLVVILDEPLLGLHPQLHITMLSTLAAIANSGRIVIIMCEPSAAKSIKSFMNTSDVNFEFRKLAEA